METKQIIVIRKDLHMRKGKMIAQGAHASMKVFFDHFVYLSLIRENKLHTYKCLVTEPMKDWIEGIFTKIVVYVNSEEELDDLALLASIHGVPYAMITDNGLTEFHDQETKTALAIGPDYNEIIDEITGHLPLL